MNTKLKTVIWAYRKVVAASAIGAVALTFFVQSTLVGMVASGSAIGGLAGLLIFSLRNQ